MNCRDAQRELALFAGEDLGDSQREAEVRQHLAGCASCRRRHAGVKSALAALAVADMPGTYDSVHSLWPTLRRRIAQGDHSASAGWNWQTAAPAMAGLGVCAGLMVSTAALLRRPVVSEVAPSSTPPAATAYSYYEPLTPGSAAIPVRPISSPRPESDDKTVRGVLMRRLAVPEE